MNSKVYEFIDNFYKKSAMLKDEFKITENKKWDIFSLLSEFTVQLGHLSLLLSDYDTNAENNRKINDISDEISDVIFQTFNINRKLNADIESKKYNYEYIEFNDNKEYILNINILIGQLSESMLEEKEYRHYKVRYGYPEISDFNNEKIYKIFELLYSLCIRLKIDINSEYKNMINSAECFLKNYHIKSSIQFYPIVDVHATWMVLNPIQGCPNKCKYCFLEEKRLNGIKPIVLCSPQKAVKSLLSSNYYIKDMPLCLLSQTDAFSTMDNIEYLKQMIYYLHKYKINNPIVLITKCFIPLDFIDFLKNYENKGMKFIFFLSYSGLDSKIEKGVNHENIRNNFINLNKKNIDIVHYWRPFIPSNSNKEDILKVYNFVKEYAKCSIAIGLKTSNSIIDNIEWKELDKNRQSALEADNVWSKNAYEMIWNSNLLNCDYPIYQTTSCALCYVLKKPDFKFFYNTDICKCNKCSLSQRKICDNKENNKICKDEIIKEIKKLGYIIDAFDIEISLDEIILKNISVNLKDVSYLTEKFHKHIIVNKNKNDYYWNTSINSSKILLIE